MIILCVLCIWYYVFDGQGKYHGTWECWSFAVLSKHHGITIWYNHFAIDTLLYCKGLRLKNVKTYKSNPSVVRSIIHILQHKRPQKSLCKSDLDTMRHAGYMTGSPWLKKMSWKQMAIPASGSQASQRRLQYTSTTTSCRSRFTERMLTAEKLSTAFIEVDIKSVKCFISSLSKTRIEQIDLSVHKLLSKEVVMLWMRELIEAVTFTAFMWRFEPLFMAVPLLTRLRVLLN